MSVLAFKLCAMHRLARVRSSGRDFLQPSRHQPPPRDLRAPDPSRGFEYQTLQSSPPNRFFDRYHQHVSSSQLTLIGFMVFVKVWGYCAILCPWIFRLGGRSAGDQGSIPGWGITCRWDAPPQETFHIYIPKMHRTPIFQRFRFILQSNFSKQYLFIDK